MGAVLVAVALAGCGPSDPVAEPAAEPDATAPEAPPVTDPSESGEETEPATASEIAEYEPVTVENCGRTATYEEPPQRAVAMVVNAIELVLALDVGEQVVGTAQLTGPVSDEYADSYADVEILSDEYPSQEALLGVEADFVIGALETFSFDAAEGRGRDDLESRGIGTYALQCPEEQLTVELLYERIDEVARVFGVPERGEELAEQVRGELADAEEALGDVTPVEVFVYQGGQTAPTTLGGLGFGNVVLTLAGATNIYADLDQAVGEGSWETVAERDPGAIVVYNNNALGESAEDMTGFLEGFPGISATRAVQEDRILVVEFRDTLFGPSAAAGILQLAEFLHPEEF